MAMASTMSSTEQPRERSFAGFGQTLEDRSHRARAAHAFRDLVADVAGVEVGEDQHVGPSGDRRARRLRSGDGRGQSGVELELAIDIEAWIALASDVEGGSHLSHPGMIGAAFGGEGQQRHSGFDAEELLRVEAREPGDFRELARGRDPDSRRSPRR